MLHARFFVEKLCLLLVLALGLAVGAGCDAAGQSQTNTSMTSASLDTVITDGMFKGKEQISTSGTYDIGRSGQDLMLRLKEDFQTESGPDLYVALSPKASGKATGNNVMDEPAIRVDSLRALEGAQLYDLPDDLDLTVFNSVAIQCVQFSHLYGVAKLE